MSFAFSFLQLSIEPMSPVSSLLMPSNSLALCHLNDVVWLMLSQPIGILHLFPLPSFLSLLHFSNVLMTKGDWQTQLQRYFLQDQNHKS